MKRKDTKYIVIHCSATRPEMDIGVEEIRKWHMAKGWSDVGYHFVIRRNGKVEKGRIINDIGAHVAGYNAVSVGVCLVGGLNGNGRAVNNFTQEQMESLVSTVQYLKGLYPSAEVLGHRDLSPDKNNDGKITPDEWLKACPCFDVREWWAAVQK
jgi:N-acetyl-anhydromuramyl-L-alanine amidase AmpD